MIRSNTEKTALKLAYACWVLKEDYNNHALEEIGSQVLWRQKKNCEANVNFTPNSSSLNENQKKTELQIYQTFGEEIHLYVKLQMQIINENICKGTTQCDF